MTYKYKNINKYKQSLGIVSVYVHIQIIKQLAGKYSVLHAMSGAAARTGDLEDLQKKDCKKKNLECIN